MQNSKELIFYYGVYISYLTYGINVLIKARNSILNVTTTDNFSDAWWSAAYPKDSSNYELLLFANFMRSHWPWYILHIVISAVIRQFHSKWRSICNAVISAIFVVVTMHPVCAILLACVVLTYFYVAKLKSKKYIWSLSLCWMTVLIMLKNSDGLYEIVGFTDFFQILVILSWSVLRGCSFCFHFCKDNGSHEQYSFHHYCGYILYFPCLVFGPFMGFNRYSAALENNKYKMTYKEFAWQLLRVMFWWLILEISLHFLYIHSMERNVEAVRAVGTTFGLYAIAYFMGKFFFLYYVITYGFGIAIAHFDNYRPPEKPRCIGRIHFYSEMWKYFDEGLYEFLFNHIYAELCAKDSSPLRKIFASAVTFFFIFIWHGFYLYVFIWSLLNFLCVILEKLFKAMTSSSSYNKFVKTKLKLDDRGRQRLSSLLATQVFIPAAFSNIFFISGDNVGMYLLEKVYLSGFINYVLLTLLSYCFFQCSEMLFL